MSTTEKITLAEQYKQNKTMFISKSIFQIIKWAGEGYLSDDNDTSSQFRAFLSVVKDEDLIRYAHEALEENDIGKSASNSQEKGYALQDIVNEIGARVGFRVEYGYYRGKKNLIAYDGIWIDEANHHFIIETKTTSAYQIRLETIEKYRQHVAQIKEIEIDLCSVLIVTGNNDTSELEAQIRGSRFAWDMRIISITTLINMMALRKSIEDDEVIRKINQLLIPCEFTRLDKIIEIVYNSVMDVNNEQKLEEKNGIDVEKKTRETIGGNDTARDEIRKFKSKCISKLEKYLNLTMVQEAKSKYATRDKGIHLTCSVSHYHAREKRYWFSFHTYQEKYLSQFPISFAVFGCINLGRLFIVPFNVLQPFLPNLNTTSNEDRDYYHIKIGKEVEAFYIYGKGIRTRLDITNYSVLVD